MPIRKDLRPWYGAAWRRLSLQLRAEAGWRCQCLGECGGQHRGQCTAYDRRLPLLTDDEVPAGPSTQLQVCHLGHDHQTHDPSQLAVFCASCHARYDVRHHRRTIRRAEMARAEAAGQQRIV